MKPPKRRFEIRMSVSGDDLKEVQHALSTISFDLECGQVGPCVSGGVGSGWHWELTEDPAMTHEIYVQKLKEYLAWKKENPE